MLVKQLRLANYRNYSRKVLDFSPGLNIIIGDNGVGKTNILESIVFVSNTKSFRTGNDQNLIKDDEEFSRIDLLSDEGSFKVVINRKNKSLFYNDVLVKRASDYIGKLNAILFKPSDLELFMQSPSERRKVLDIEIDKISNRYIQALLKYESLLKDKNRLLKETEIDDTLFSVINESMVPPIKTIIEEREDFFEHINRNISSIYSRISDEDRKISVKYRKCCETENIEEELERTKEKDLYYHYAVFGPHHDDYSFMMDDTDVNAMASQGQKRMVLIAFKFSLIDYIKEKTGKVPILLLDDILSELDRDNKERLLNIIPKGIQTIITDTDIDRLDVREEYRLIEIKEEENVQHIHQA
ncbi:MAG: DNA replication/repair protein RecF [Erysipelotrichaceae bacterium]|nr:DNA replication/repair protein RecF [Erysipelotrichaceae bacterium]